VWEECDVRVAASVEGNETRMATIWLESRDYRLETLSADLVAAVEGTREQMGWAGLPRMFFVGHSLGGAVVVNVANNRSFGNKFLGFTVIDVVEGSARDALTFMNRWLDSRPRRFDGLQAAIDWTVRSRTVHNAASAHITVPDLVVKDGAKSQQYSWRTDLKVTAPFWDEWFTGMSKKFVGSRGAKMLLLAGTDRLDKELMIAQMQGELVVRHIIHYCH
jgi:protein phosphatase methylesterase 1